ncbi:MFS transporter [Cryptosporangium phraense]|uniref:MFS transporter n=2 Tax=Cryptosporangium phraense TaxID=2593070 RepID=A0A545AQ98_9ACTN|nr:MFS transporter [Cryptosporangium phraense]
MPETAPAEPAARRRGTFRALGSRPFRLYFAGQVASASGTFLQQTAIGWLVLQLTHSASALGLVLAAGGIPSLLLGPWGGALADRIDLRRLLLATQAAYAVCAGLLWALAASGHASVAAIVAINVVAGLVSIPDSPARQAFVSALVPPDDLASAVSLNGVVVNGARVIGPALAGALIVTVGTTPCFAVNAISYLAVIVALLFVRPRSAGRRPAGRAGVGAALTYARGRQQLWLPLTMMALVGLFAFNFAVVLPVLADRTLHGGGGTYSLLSTMLSIGSVAGSLAVGLVRHPRRPYLVAAAAAFGVGLALTAVAPGVVVACASLLVTGVAAFSFVTLCSTTLQLHSSSEFRGRVMALWVFVYLGTTPIGSVLTGWIVSAGGPRAALWVGAAACLVAALVAGRVHTPPHPDAAYADLPR